MKLSFAQRFLSQSTANLLLNPLVPSFKQAIEEPEQHYLSFHRTDGQINLWPKARSSRSQLSEQFPLIFYCSCDYRWERKPSTLPTKEETWFKHCYKNNTMLLRFFFFCYLLLLLLFLCFFLMPKAASKSMCFHFAFYVSHAPLPPHCP